MQYWEINNAIPVLLKVWFYKYLKRTVHQEKRIFRIKITDSTSTIGMSLAWLGLCKSDNNL